MRSVFVYLNTIVVFMYNDWGGVKDFCETITGVIDETNANKNLCCTISSLTPAIDNISCQ